MRTADRGIAPHDKFAPLTEDEFRGLMTEPEREALAVMLADAREAGYWAGYHARTVECVRDHSAIANRIDAASRAFYLLEASDFHRDEVGA